MTGEEETATGKIMFYKREAMVSVALFLLVLQKQTLCTSLYITIVSMRNVKCYQGGARSSTGAGCNSTIELAPNSKVVKTRHLVSVFLDLGFFLQYLSTQPTYLQILRWCFRGQKEEKGSPSFAGRPRMVLALIVKIRIKVKIYHFLFCTGMF